MSVRHPLTVPAVAVAAAPRRRATWPALLLAVALVGLTGCEPAPKPDANQAEFTPDQWDVFVTRHMGRGMGRLQFAVPPGWKVTYQHDTVHPRMIISNRTDLQAPDVSYLVVGLTEEAVFDLKKFDGPPAVWNAADYSPVTSEFERAKIDRKETVEHLGHLGQGVRWRTTQTTPAIGDWEFVWKHGVDPGPLAVDRDQQRLNKFDEYLKANPGAPVDYFREYYTYGWGVRPKSWMQIYYKAHNDSVRRLIEAMLPTVNEYRHSETALVSVEVGLLGGPVPRAAWNQLVATDTAPATAPAPAPPPAVNPPATPATPAAP